MTRGGFGVAPGVAPGVGPGVGRGAVKGAAWVASGSATGNPGATAGVGAAPTVDPVEAAPVDPAVKDDADAPVSSRSQRGRGDAWVDSGSANGTPGAWVGGRSCDPRLSSSGRLVPPGPVRASGARKAVAADRLVTVWGLRSPRKWLRASATEAAVTVTVGFSWPRSSRRHSVSSSRGTPARTWRGRQT